MSGRRWRGPGLVSSLRSSYRDVSKVVKTKKSCSRRTFLNRDIEVFALVFEYPNVSMSTAAGRGAVAGVLIRVTIAGSRYQICL